MKIEYKLIEQDYFDFNLFTSRYSQTLRKAYFKNRYITGVCFFIIPLLALITDIPAWYWAIVSMITCGIWILRYPKLYESRLKKIVFKMLREPNNNILGDKTLSLEEDGFIASDISTESKTNWSGVLNIEETENHIFILLNLTSGYMIPLRAFKNIEEKAEFLNVLKTKTGKI